MGDAADDALQDRDHAPKLTVNTAATPAIPIVESHLHFLDRRRFDYPWLDAADTSFLRGADHYLPDDWRADVDELDIVGAVHVQAEVNHDIDPVAETEWLAALGPVGAPLAYVAYADLRAPDVDDVLARHREHDMMRGIRQEAWFDPASTRADLPRDNMLLDPRWRAGLARLPAHGLSFDLFVWWHQLDQAAEIFAALPELTVVVEHTGLPPLGDDDALRGWRSALARFADQVPTSTLKISGIGLFGKHWTIAAIAPVLRQAIEQFGPDRCMFGSNYPVDRAVASYRQIWSAYDQITADLTGAERSALFSGTATRVYRLPTGSHLAEGGSNACAASIDV